MDIVLLILKGLGAALIIAGLFFLDSPASSTPP